jgi:hypothetical protein
MSDTQENIGATVITGAAILRYREVAAAMALATEINTGLKMTRHNVKTVADSITGVKGRTKVKSLEALVKRLEDTYHWEASASVLKAIGR